MNNYLWVGIDGGVERIGAYVKELSAVDNDLPILNKALVDYMVKKTPVEQTINQCDDLIGRNSEGRIEDCQVIRQV